MYGYGQKQPVTVATTCMSAMPKTEYDLERIVNNGALFSFQRRIEPYEKIL